MIRVEIKYFEISYKICIKNNIYIYIYIFHEMSMDWGHFAIHSHGYVLTK